MTALHSVRLNPAILKAQTRARGVVLDPSTQAWIESCGGAPQPAANLDLILPEDLAVTAPITSGQKSRSAPLRLSGSDEQLQLICDSDTVAVRFVPPPDYYGRTTKSGVPMQQIGRVHGGFLAITPDNACGVAWVGHACPTCRGEARDAPPVAASVEDVAEVVSAAFAEGAAEFVYFNIPATGTADAGLPALAPYVEAIKRTFDTVIAVQAHPPAANHWIDHAYGLGVDAIAFSLESSTPESLQRVFPGRAATFGAARYQEALTYAANVFPSGTVWSEILVGIDPAEKTSESIRDLTQRGVLPVLSLADDQALQQFGIEPTTSREQTDVLLRHLFDATRDARINMGWVRDFSMALTPLEARFSSPDGAGLSLTLQQFYRSKLGGLAARNLARLRRRLRVRRVSDSFDSSHL